MPINGAGGILAKGAVSYDRILDFLNGDVSDRFLRTIQSSPDWLDARETLKRCVDAILQFREKTKDVTKTEGSLRQLTPAVRLVFLGQELSRMIHEETERLLEKCELKFPPGSVMTDYLNEAVQGSDEQIHAAASFLLNIDKVLSIEQAESAVDQIGLPDLKRVFSQSSVLVATPSDGDYVLSFLALLSDPEYGIPKLFRCQHCERIGLATYSRQQKFCSKARTGRTCALDYHNARKARAMAAYMRKYRRTKKILGHPLK